MNSPSNVSTGIVVLSTFFAGAVTSPSASAASGFDKIVTEDFEMPAVKTELSVPNPYEALSNITFEAPETDLFILPESSVITDGSQQLLVSDPADFKLTYKEGERFIPLSIEIDNRETGTPSSLDVIFQTQAGEEITTTLDIDGERGLQTFHFDDLVSEDDPVVSWTFGENDQSYTYDNVRIATVPTQTGGGGGYPIYGRGLDFYQFDIYSLNDPFLCFGGGGFGGGGGGGGHTPYIEPPTPVIPTPGTAAVLGVGALALTARRRRP